MSVSVKQAIKRMEQNCDEKKKRNYPKLSFLLMAKIYYTENEISEAHKCLVHALNVPVATIDVIKLFLYSTVAYLNLLTI